MTIAETQIFEAPKPHRFTRDEYYQMVDLGFFQGKRVELIDGEIIDMSPQLDRHAAALLLIHSLLTSAVKNAVVRPQLPLTLEGDTEPEPDIAVVAGSIRDFVGLGHHPRTALLVVEISETTLGFDRGRKAELYAAAEIQEYWIVNLKQRQIEVLRNPKAGKYEMKSVHKSGESITPLAAPDASLPVADMLP